MVFDPQQARQTRTTNRMRAEGNGVFNAAAQAPRASERPARTGMRIASPKPQAPPVQIVPPQQPQQPGQYSTGPQAAAQGAGPGVQPNAATQQQGAMNNPALTPPPMRPAPTTVAGPPPMVIGVAQGTIRGGYTALDPVRGNPPKDDYDPLNPAGGFGRYGTLPSSTVRRDGSYVGDGGFTQGPLPSDAGRSVDEVIAMLLGTDVANTEEEEALLREMMGLQSGKAIADQRARFATAGLGGASALAGVEADIYGENARDTSQHIFDLRRDARDEEFERLMGGLSASAVDRGLDLRDEEREALLAALNEEIDVPDGDGILSEDGERVVGQGIENILSLLGLDFEFGEPRQVNSRPPGTTITGVTPGDGGEYRGFEDKDGKQYFMFVPYQETERGSVSMTI